MPNRLTDLRRDERGQGLMEYVLLLAFIAVVCVGTVGVFGTTVNQTLQDAGVGLTL